MKQHVERAGFAVLSVALLAWGWVEGILTMSISLDLSFVAIALGVFKAELDALTFAAFLAVSGFIYFVHRFRAGGERARTDGGTLTAIVPVYEDAGVLRRSVDSLRNSAYEAVEVVVVCEPDDRETREVAQRLAELSNVRCLVNDAEPGTKAGAINYALEMTEGEYVGVFDADELVDPAFLPHAVGEFVADPTLDAVQGRTVPEPDGFIESIAYYESVLMSFVVLRIAYLLTGFRMAVSRCIVFRRSSLEELGGYDPDMLTEDFAFTYDAYKERLNVHEMLQYPSRIDAAHTPADWWGQRKRWMTGYTQVLHRELLDIRPLTDHRNLLSLVICFSTVTGSLFLITLISKFVILLLVGSPLVFVTPIAVMLGITGGAHYLDYREGTVSRPGPMLLVVPFIFPAYSLAAVKAMFEYLFSWDGEWYRVTKRA
jgi:cellulose synthase/poly-beta-1,6-N-acetylglucosamine synthase-like glycosyltransferase